MARTPSALTQCLLCLHQSILDPSEPSGPWPDTTIIKEASEGYFHLILGLSSAWESLICWTWSGAFQLGFIAVIMYFRNLAGWGRLQMSKIWHSWLGFSRRICICFLFLFLFFSLDAVVDVLIWLTIRDLDGIDYIRTRHMTSGWLVCLLYGIFVLKG